MLEEKSKVWLWLDARAELANGYGVELKDDSGGLSIIYEGLKIICTPKGEIKLRFTYKHTSKGNYVPLGPNDMKILYKEGWIVGALKLGIYHSMLGADSMSVDDNFFTKRISKLNKKLNVYKKQE
jgi:hypothetical protein